MRRSFSFRLRSAMIMKGYSLDDLAKVLHPAIDIDLLNGYVRGIELPDRHALYKLCNALDVRPDFFVRQIHVVLESAVFEKGEELSVKEWSILREKTIDAMERYIELEELLGIEPSDKVIDLEATPAFTCVALWKEKRYPVSVITADPHHKSNRFMQLVHRALAEEVISMSKAAALCNMKLSAFRKRV